MKRVSGWIYATIKVRVKSDEIMLPEVSDSPDAAIEIIEKNSESIKAKLEDIPHFHSWVSTEVFLDDDQTFLFKWD